MLRDGIEVFGLMLFGLGVLFQASFGLLANIKPIDAHDVQIMICCWLMSTNRILPPA